MRIYRVAGVGIKELLRPILSLFERLLVSIPFEYKGQLYQEVLVAGTFPGMDRATPKGILYLDSRGDLEIKKAQSLVQHLSDVSWIYNIDIPDQDFGTLMFQELAQGKQKAWQKEQSALQFLLEKGHTESESLMTLLVQSQRLENELLNSMRDKARAVTVSVMHMGYVDSNLMARLSMDEYWSAANRLRCLYYEISVLWQQIVPIAKRTNTPWLRLLRPTISSALDFILVNESTFNPKTNTVIPIEEYISEKKQLHCERRLSLLRIK